MSWGSPTFLSYYWYKKKIPNVEKTSTTKSYALGSRKLLRNKIKQLHKKIGNAETKDKYIVVAAGASQILLGLFHVLREEGYGCSAHAERPHFSRFPVLANFAAVDWIKAPSAITIVTNPNNPDGSIKDHSEATILDLCYNWPQYTQTIKYNHSIMVFSLSKSTGHANTRIGWALIKNRVIAKKLERYIELSTGGLSIDAQLKAEKIIATQLKTKNTVFEYGERILTRRWKKLLSLKNKLPFEILNNSGMFLWAKGKCPPEILGLNGEELGGTYENFRLNIGCSERTFKKFIKLLTND